MIENLRHLFLISIFTIILTACGSKESKDDQANAKLEQDVKSLSYEDVQGKNAEAKALITKREKELLEQFEKDDLAATAKSKSKKRQSKSNSNFGIGEYKIIATERSVSMSTAAGNLLVTSDEKGLLQQTQDYGKTWQTIDNPVGELPSFMQFTADGKHAVFISKDGKIFSNVNDVNQYTTFDLGENTPKSYAKDYSQGLNTINFSTDLKNGQLVAWCNIWQTRDGGQSWKIVGGNLLNNNSDHCFEKAYVNAEHELNFALMYINTGYGTNKLYQTNDKGQTWENVCPHDLVTSLDGIDPICPEGFASPDNFNKELRYFEIRNEGELASETIKNIFDTKSVLVGGADIAKFNMGNKFFYKQANGLWLLSGNYIAFSKNSGLDWTLINSPNLLTGEMGWVLEEGDRKVFVSSGGGSKVKQGDGAWTYYSNEQLDMEISYYDQRTRQLFAQSELGVHTSTDLAKSWEFVPGTKGEVYPTPFHSAERNWIMSLSDGLVTLVWDENGEWKNHSVVTAFDDAIMQCSNNACVIFDDKNLEKYILQNDGNIKVRKAKTNFNNPEDLGNIADFFVNSELDRLSYYDYEQGLFVKDNLASSWTKIKHPKDTEVTHSKSIFGDKSYLIAVTDSDREKNNKFYYTDLNKDQAGSMALPGSQNTYVYDYRKICWLDTDNGLLSITRDYPKNNDYISEDITYITEDGGKTWKTNKIDYDGTCLHFSDKILVGSSYIAK